MGVVTQLLLVKVLCPLFAGFQVFLRGRLLADEFDSVHFFQVFVAGYNLSVV